MQTTLGSVDEILEELLEKFPKIRSAMIITKEGLPVASLLSDDLINILIAPIAAAIINIGEKSNNTLEAGDFELLTVSGSKFNIVFLDAGELILLVSVEKNINPRKIYIESSEIRKRISKTV